MENNQKISLRRETCIMYWLSQKIRLTAEQAKYAKSVNILFNIHMYGYRWY